ncbi:hypothetical protein ACP70R_030237 [Stipagrostis hirtigluma subsp. patula]
MASLLLFLRAIVVGSDAEDRFGAPPEKAKQQLEMRRFPGKHAMTACGCRDSVAEEEERWLVACLQWSLVDRKAAWMQIV